MWVLDVETEIFAYIKAKVNSSLSATYPSLNFTMDNTPQTEPKFPCVYIHFLGSVEQGETLDENTVNAIDTTVQYEVTVTKEQGLGACRRVSSEIMSALSELKFRHVTSATFENNSPDTKRMVGRARRIIASGDTTI